MKQTPDVHQDSPPNRPPSIKRLLFLSATLGLSIVIMGIYVILTYKSPALYPANQAVSVHNIPSTMEIRQAEKITVRLSKRMSEDLFRNLQGNGNIEISKIPFTSSANVSLTGDEGFFDISLKNGLEEKALMSDRYTDWYFEVIPKQAGEASLYLNINLISQNETGKQSVRELPTVRKIKIKDDSIGNFFIFLKTNSVAILAIVATIIVGLLAISEVRKKLSAIYNSFAGKVKQILGK